MTKSTKYAAQVGPMGLALTLVVCLVALFATTGLPFTGIRSATAQGRTCEVDKKTFPSQALEIKEIRNLQSSSFLEDFEIEVKNISNKPVYFFYFVVLFPDAKSNGAAPIGLRVQYGNIELLMSGIKKDGKRAKPEDTPLKPGESCIVKFDPAKVKGLRSVISKGTLQLSDFDRIIIYAQDVNFGDGTGFKMHRAYPL